MNNGTWSVLVNVLQLFIIGILLIVIAGIATWFGDKHALGTDLWARMRRGIGTFLDPV